MRKGRKLQVQCTYSPNRKCCTLTTFKVIQANVSILQEVNDVEKFDVKDLNIDKRKDVDFEIKGKI